MQSIAENTSALASLTDKKTAKNIHNVSFLLSKLIRRQSHPIELISILCRPLRYLLDLLEARNKLAAATPWAVTYQESLHDLRIGALIAQSLRVGRVLLDRRSTRCHMRTRAAKASFPCMPTAVPILPAPNSLLAPPVSFCHRLGRKEWNMLKFLRIQLS